MTLPKFVCKAQATGNDFLLYIDSQGVYEPTCDEVRRLCDRHFGIGADGLIRVAHPEAVSDIDAGMLHACHHVGALWFMDYRNADGSLAEMCGNGTRAVALFAQHEGLADQPGGEPFVLGTRAGVRTLRSLGSMYPYGDAVFEVSLGGSRAVHQDAYRVSLPGVAGSWSGTFVDMGNPHVVVVEAGRGGNSRDRNGWVEDRREGDGGALGRLDSSLRAGEGMSVLPDVDALDLSWPPSVEPCIATGQNVEFVRIDGIEDSQGCGAATMRVFERGCGETLSCGTGLGATAVTLSKKTGIDEWDVRVRGGVLHVSVSDEDVKLTGNAALVGCVELW